MLTPTLVKRPFFSRLFTVLVFLLAALLVAGGLTTGWAAQDESKPGQKKEEEEEPPKKQKEKEEEEPGAKTPNKPLRVGDEDTDERPASRTAGTQVADLKREADRAKDPNIQELYRSLAQPHDVLTKPSGRTLNVAPIADYIGPVPNEKKLDVHPFKADGKLGPVETYHPGEINSEEPYEALALRKVNEFLQRSPGPEATGEQLDERQRRIQAAETVLAAVINFHDSARRRGTRTGEGWQGLEKKLRNKLRDVQLVHLAILADREQWEDAFSLAVQLADDYPNDEKVQVEAAQLLLKNAGKWIRSKNFDVVRQRLLAIQQKFPNSPELKGVRDDLRKAAQDLFDQAKNEEEKKDHVTARRLLQQAEAIYPQLPGLHDYLLRLTTEKYPILYVGVRDLPANLSPALACTNAEQQALELLFESLVKLSYNPAEGERFEPDLAEQLPRQVPLGRSFELLHNVYWAVPPNQQKEPDPVTASDVRHTAELLKDPRLPRRVPEWASLIRDVRDEGTPYRVRVTLSQGYLDPLSLMDFKVLPEKWVTPKGEARTLSHAYDPDFARTPIGSGPYRYEGQEKEQGRSGKVAVFRASPYYEVRAGKIGRPFVREVRFVPLGGNPKVDELTSDLQNDRLHVLLDLPTKTFAQLKSGLQGTAQFLTVTTGGNNRRIYFLAVNHRKPELRGVATGSAGRALRRAIGYAIHRDKILDECFRDPAVPNLHHPLNGPYPPGSWACNPDLQTHPDPFDPTQAKAQASVARGQLPTLRALTLKYPSGDPEVEAACKMICDQVKTTTGIELQPVSRSPRELRHDVEDEHDYDLAYYHWDYSSEAYWLGPLFDPGATDPGGLNFLGYDNDNDLAGFFSQMLTRRTPAVVRQTAHQIHSHISEYMPFIPLWQLDVNVVIHGSVQLPSAQLEPRRIFADVDEWKLQKQQ